MLSQLVFVYITLTISVVRSVTVSVDLGLDNHEISPLIYGVNFITDAQINLAKIPMTRWGGNTCTRYNYKVDTYNTANDYYFENIPSCWGGTCPPADPQEDSAANQLLQTALDHNITTFLTVPTLGYIAKDATYNHPFPCGFPVSTLGSQDSVDPYDTNCGNGLKTDGSTKLTAPNPNTTTSVLVTPQWNQDWATYLVSKFGPSNGKRIYQMDNEPNLWSSTHRDVHPSSTSYDELWQKLRDNAIAVLNADPTALVAGVCEWGWPNYFCSAKDLENTYCSSSSPDRAAHNGLDLTTWLLRQAKAYEDANGKRILHYLDLHYYPQGGNNPERTRSLWDSTYTDPSWINDKIYLIPRMVAWVNDNYPGTKISLGEYDFYDHTTAEGALALAEALGIFGREGLHAATHWGAPDVTDLAFSAFVLYTNYDGSGSGFESTSCRATSDDSTVYAFAAYGSTGVTIVLCNEGSSSATVSVQLSNFTTSATVAKFWAPTGSGSTVGSSDVNFSGTAISVNVPATSFGMLVVPGTGGSTTGSTTGNSGSTTDSGGATPLSTGDSSGAVSVAYCALLLICSLSVLIL